MSDTYDSIIQKYPDIFGTPPFYDGNKIIGYGFECGGGWYSILEETFDKIQELIDSKRISVRVIQVKEKFGSLRIYYDGGDKDVAYIISEAEEKSMNTCEVCGKPGSLKSSGWMRVLCSDHNNS